MEMKVENVTQLIKEQQNSDNTGKQIEKWNLIKLKKLLYSKGIII